MRTLISPLALIAALGAGSVALADSTTGTIAEISPVTGDVTLQNGMAFDFTEADADMLDTFKTGDRVSIVWSTVGDSMQGRQISPASGGANELTGIVAEISDATGMVTLANGMMVDFTDSESGDLDNFAPGDTVSIHYATVGDERQGLNIKPAGTSARVATGTIQDLNETSGDLRLANGSEFDFNGMDDRLLANFSEGDRVAIHYLTEGDAMVALSISPAS